MSVALEIVPFADALNMYGEPDRSTAYSLSGHVSITLSPSTYYLSRSRSARVLLRSLVVTFEGQSEVVTQETGYAGCRLFDTSQELIQEPLELTLNEYDTASTWNIVFNLTVPGWLPSSSPAMDLERGASSTKYAVFARAEFSSLDECSGTSLLSSLSSLCFPIFSRMRATTAPVCDITLNRFMSQEEDLLSDSVPTTANHIIAMVFAEPPPKECADRPRIPLDVLSKLRFSVAVPEYVDVNGSELDVALRMRTEDMPREECERIRFTSFMLDVEQIEKYRISPSSQYKARFPLPPKSEQPPHRPLLNPHPMQAIFELGLGANHTLASSCARQFSLLPSDTAGLYNIDGDGYAFMQDADAARNNTWYALKTDVPFAQAAPEKSKGAQPPRRLRESCAGPLFGATHKLHVALTCTYDLTEGEQPERAVERLHFHVPLRFARVLPVVPAVRCATPPFLGHSPASSTESVDTTALLLGDRFLAPSRSLPYAPTLPAYSQLFDTNGDRKIDYSIPLPAYTPRSPSDGDVELCSFTDLSPDA